mgnify:FL=1
MSMIWAYNDIIYRLQLTNDNTFEKVYYKSMIYKTKDNICLELLSNIEAEINKRDFKAMGLR